VDILFSAAPTQRDDGHGGDSAARENPKPTRHCNPDADTPNRSHAD